MFVAVHMTAVPDHLNGYLSRYLHQVSATLFVGTVNPRVADAIEARISATYSEGSVAVVRSETEAEPGYRITYFRSDQPWVLRDFDGLQIVTWQP